MSEEEDNSSLASHAQGGRSHCEKDYSKSEEESESLASCTRGGNSSSKKQSTLLSFVVPKKRPNDNGAENTDHNSESSNRSFDHHMSDCEDSDVAKSSNIKELKEKELRLLDELIAVREKKLLELKAEQDTFFGPKETSTVTTALSKTTFLVNKYGTKRTHPDNKDITASTYTRYNKKTKVNMVGKRYLKISLLEDYPWAIYVKGSFESDQGLVKCGLCCEAKEKGCEMWYRGKKLQRKVGWMAVTVGST